MRIARARLADERVVDSLLAALLTVAVLLEVSTQRQRGLPALVSVLVTTPVAWRHRDPVLATLVAVAATVLYQLATGTSVLLIEEVAVALCFYALGRLTARSGRVLASVALLASWFVAAAVIAYRTHELSVVQLATVWASVGGLPFAVGRTLATRGALTLELAASASRLEDAQELRAERAAGEERTRMARELHDVIAHDVSVMVIQASAARRVVRGDLAAARAAMQVVEDAGRDALVELRRTVGVLRRENDELAGSAAPGISQLEALAERARAAGLAVDLRVEGPRVALSPGIDLVAYRVVQEALTNVIKHAGAGVTAEVRVRIDDRARELELAVLDSGSGL
jgi:signal transduction histidine kinase